MNKFQDTLVIGTRGSELALKQSEIIRQKIADYDRNINVELKIIKTEGDKNQNPIPLDVVGKGWFTKEIEQALLRGDVDVAVHSLKDLPEELPKGLCIGAYPEREDPRDCLVSMGNLKLNELPTGTIIGTDSLRRRVQILAIRPDLIVKSIRGNVQTRIKKMFDGEYGGVILAVAGLKRLNLESSIVECFESEQMTSAPGQGILAVEVRGGDEKTNKIIRAINNDKIEEIAEVERFFSALIGGGCKSPIGVYADKVGDTYTVHLMVAKDDNSKIFRKVVRSDSSKIRRELKEVAKEIKNKFF